VFKDWSNVHGNASIDFIIPDPYAFLNSLIVACFTYIFAIQIIRHHRGETSQKGVWIPAVLTLFPLTPIFILSLFGVSISAGGGFSGPIPLFLILGLIIDRYWGIEPAVQPWDEEKVILPK
ncbi:MAG: hypothetical protein KAQ65_12730, partial [Candidatus Thorarchaeota archaeon]|nr:hypothetical protein [Candidatus Thorarchaeota archaeon]